MQMIDYEASDIELSHLAKEQGVPYKLNASRIKALFKIKTCTLSGEVFRSIADKSITLINPKKGFVKGNVIVVMPQYVGTTLKEASIQHINNIAEDIANCEESLQACKAVVSDAEKHEAKMYENYRQAQEQTKVAFTHANTAETLLMEANEAYGYAKVAEATTARLLAKKQGLFSRLFGG